jgi:nicotinate dehydrogenase subunit A
MTSFALTVNGEAVTVEADPDTSLLDVLRGPLGLRGSRFGCGLGLCGACAVRLDRAVVRSCDTPVWAAADQAVVTIEGLGSAEEPHPVQRALLAEQAAQCGFCISGIAVAAAALLETNPHPTPGEVAAALDRHLCRCGAQQRIIRAVVRAGEAG